MSEVKRNMIQVRLTDAQFVAFNQIKKAFGANSNAAAIRQLIGDKKLIGNSNHAEITAINQKYDDLLAKVSALLWNSSNITKNLNEIAHAANVAKNTDPSNTETWNWIIDRLNAISPTIQQFQQVSNDVKSYLRQSCDNYGNTHF